MHDTTLRIGLARAFYKVHPSVRYGDRFFHPEVCMLKADVLYGCVM